MFCLFLLFATGCLQACTQDSTSLTTWRLGNATITIETTCIPPCSDSISFINVHENEVTSVFAAREFLKDFGGRLTVLQQDKERYLSFYLNKQRFVVDPNRIFTTDGVRATLGTLSKYNAEAARQTEGLAKQLLTQFIDGQKLVIALHNNTDSNYSIASYIDDGAEAINAREVFINDEMDADDFVVTTDSAIFYQVKELNINVILQDNEKLKDDGSLSVYAGKKGIPYINVEAQEGHMEEQLEILKSLAPIIAQYRTKGD